MAVKQRDALTIQCAARQFIARRIAREKLETKLKAAEVIRKHEAEQLRQAQEEAEMNKRSNPRTPADFQKLTHQVEAWVKQETERIRAIAKNKAERQTMFNDLVRKETKLIQQIDRLRIKAHKENTQMRITNTLQMMASPKVWEMSNGKVKSFTCVIDFVLLKGGKFLSNFRD